MNNTVTQPVAASSKSVARTPRHSSWCTLFYLVPMNLVSFAVGWLMRIEWPPPIQRILNQGFARLFRLDLSEAEEPLESFPSLEALFIRSLKPGARPNAGPLVSPADGTMAVAASIEQGTLIQAKRFPIEAEELVFGESAARRDQLGLSHYLTIYLAPHNYHRVHAPARGQVTAIYYVPGELWPVNQTFTRSIPRIFTRNERLSFAMDLDGGGRMYVVMVGAFNVGRMVTPLVPELSTNGWERQWGARPCKWPLLAPRAVEVGDELGTFMLGSTVILLFDEAATARFSLPSTGAARAIKVGESLETGGRDDLG